jgi:hypothetical protein
MRRAAAERAYYPAAFAETLMLRTTVLAIGFLIAFWLLSFGLAEVLVRKPAAFSAYACKDGTTLLIRPIEHRIGSGSKGNSWECKFPDGTTITCWRCFLVFTPAVVGFVGLFVIAWRGWFRRRAVLQAIDRLEMQRKMGFGSSAQYDELRRDLDKRLDDAN